MVCKYANAAIAWQSKMQQCVAVSTTEAQYVSACLATKEIIWLKKLFNDNKIDVDKYILFIENVSAIKFIKNPEFHQRSKRIDVKYHFVRDNYQKGEIDVIYVKSELQVADVFTKASSKPKLMYLTPELGLKSMSEI